MLDKHFAKCSITAYDVFFKLQNYHLHYVRGYSEGVQGAALCELTSEEGFG